MVSVPSDICMELWGVRSSTYKGKVAFNISLSRQCNAQLFLFVQCGLQMWFHCRLHMKVEKKTCFDAVKLQCGNLELEKKKKDLSGEKRKAVQKRTCKLEEWIRSAEFLWPKAKNESDLSQPSKWGFQRSGASDLLPCEKLDWDGENGNSECDYEVCKQLAKGKQERPKRKWGLGAFASGISYVSVLQLNRVNFFVNHWNTATASLGLMRSWEALI